MSQQKAASLTSSLFARKGRASPAGLLISELQEGVPEVGIAAFAEDLDDRHESKELKLSARALNGHAGRRRTREAETELPLLAFVEAQLAADGIPAEEPQAEAPEEASAKSLTAEAEPAASLLGRGGGALRRANGRARAAGSIAENGVVQPVEAEAEVVIASETEVAPEVVAEAATVSGDDNVTAIEDAPAEESGPDVSVDADVETVVEPAEEETRTALVVEAAENPSAESGGTAGVVLVAPEEPAAAATEAVEETPAQPSAEVKQAEASRRTAHAPSATPSTVSQADRDAAISVTLALRKAEALQAEAPPAAGKRVQAAPAPQRIAERALPWRSAAVLALGVLLGLGAYVALSDPPPDASVEVAVTAVAPPAEAPADEAPAAVGAQPQPGGETAQAAPLETAAEAPAPAVPLPEPSFDIIRIEPDGQSIIAGRAAPFSEWILLNNGEPIASIKADANGEWVVLPDASLVPGANAFSLVPKAEQGKVAIPAPAATTAPAPVEAEPVAPRSDAAPRAAVRQGERAVEQADEQAGERHSAFTLPKPKPTARPPSYGVVASGLYQVQVASVRRSADAERERQRLAAAYPQLLGRLDLQVQEAAVEGAGTFFRVRSGALEDLGAARDVCRRLEAAGQGCLVVRRSAELEAPQAEEASEVVQKESFKLPPPARQQAQRPQ